MKRFKKFGTALLSCMMLTASFTTVSNMTMITAEAHQGRTDAQGGHHDYKNKSGLGSYHYHCGGHEAHLHPNGVCPYKNGAVSNGNTSSQTQTQTQAQSAGNQNQVAEQMNTYQPVFDANYYYMNNPDLQSVIGLDSQKLFEHFYTCGMVEGRRASENFDVSVYKANNPDLAAVFGDDLKAYYTQLCAEWAVGETGFANKNRRWKRKAMRLCNKAAWLSIFAFLKPTSASFVSWKTKTGAGKLPCSRV